MDRRAALPQELVGGNAGAPCARTRPIRWEDALPEVGLRVRNEPGEILPGARADRVPELLPFTGTHNLSWGMARARSTGALKLRTEEVSHPGGNILSISHVPDNGVVDRALKLRTQDDLELLVQVLCSMTSSEKPEELRHFRQPYNAHRHTVSNAVSSDRRRKQVLSALQKYPLCNIYDLARCSPRRWSGISRELGGASHGTAMRLATEYVQKSMCPLDRASFWTSVGTRTKVIDHGRICGFAGDQVQVTRNRSWEGI